MPKPPRPKTPKTNQDALQEADALFEAALGEDIAPTDHTDDDALFEVSIAIGETIDPTTSQPKSTASTGEDDLFVKAMEDETWSPEVGATDGEDTSSDSTPARLTTASILKRCRQGKLAPEITIDLHGLHQEPARQILRERLLEALSKKRRVALIITGRGLHSAGRAVLKTQTPIWLKEDNGDLVEGFERAPKALGGEGALLVILRRGASSQDSSED